MSALCRTAAAVQRGIPSVSAGASVGNMARLSSPRYNYCLPSLGEAITGSSREDSATFLACTSSSSSIHDTGIGAGMQIKLQEI